MSAMPHGTSRAELAAMQASRELRERRDEDELRRYECTCRVPLPVRCYLARWQCGRCMLVIVDGRPRV